MKFAIIIPYKVNRGWLDKALKTSNKQKLEEPHEILIVESQSDNTVGYNINEGFKALGEKVDFVRFLCEDDELTYTSVQDSIDYFNEHPEIDFFHSCAKTIDENGNEIGEYIPTHTPINADQLARKNYIHGGTVVYRAKCFEAHEWDVDAWTGEELEYNLRLLANGFKLGYNKCFTYRYRRHDAQKSQRLNRNLKVRVDFIKNMRAKYRSE